MTRHGSKRAEPNPERGDRRLLRALALACILASLGGLGPLRAEIRVPRPPAVDSDAAGRISASADRGFEVLGPAGRGWFRAAVLALLGVAGALAVWQVRQLLAIERLRAGIATDLHDHVGAGLTEIAILAEIASRRAEGTEAAPELARVAETARGLIDRMDDIVWLVNPRRDSLHELFVRLKDSYSELFAAQGATFSAGNLRPLEGVRLPMVQRENLYAIFCEALANALRHGGCREVSLSAERRRGTLEVTLRDDGAGFDPEAATAGDGLANLRARAAKLGGRLEVESAPGEGTTVRFRGPIG